MASESSGGVAAVVINYNGAALLDGCLGSLAEQTQAPAEIVVIDNRSTDDSLAVLRERWPATRRIELPANLGYAGAANVGIRATEAPYVLLLNPDVVLTPAFLAELIPVAAGRPDVGSLTGKLLRVRASGPAVIDSTGHLLFRNRWAVNRGEGQADRGQYDEPGEVFGVSGAAALYRRAMLDDVRVGDEYLAERFFLYLEDVDLDWRARLGGWRSYYVPTAMAYHERGYKGGARRRSAAILRHSLKNRYLLMLRNDTLRDVLLDAWAILPMEVLRFFDFLLTTPRCLAGYVDALRLAPWALHERRAIRRGVRVPPVEIRRWFRRYPYRREMLERLRLFLHSAEHP
jgi:GT2 family glycosyltransferase